MLAGDLELRRALAQRAITGGLLRLRWLAAATRVELAMLKKRAMPPCWSVATAQHTGKLCVQKRVPAVPNQQQGPRD